MIPSSISKWLPLVLLTLCCANQITGFIDEKSGKFLTSMLDKPVKDFEKNLAALPSNAKAPLQAKKARKGESKSTPVATSADNLKSIPKNTRYLISTGESKKKGGCHQATYLFPGRPPIPFSLSDNVYKLKERVCSWSFFAVDGCRAVISCSSINLTNDCDKEYMEIVDGGKGNLKICGGNHVSLEDIASSGTLRDIYINYHGPQSSAPKPTGSKLFSCSVTCAKPDQTLKQLEAKANIRTNNKCYCGTKPGQTRIVGGKRGATSDYPWLVSIAKANSRQSSCAGAAINSKFILTANHCLHRRGMNHTNVNVVFHGERFDPIPIVEPGVEAPIKTYSPEELDRLDKGNGSLRFKVAEIIYHPKTIVKRHDYDVALVKIDGEFPFTTNDLTSNGKGVRPICLPDLGDYETDYAGKTAHIAGYGNSRTEEDGIARHLNFAKIDVLSPDQCAKYFDPENDTRVVRWRMMCAGKGGSGVDTCQGDSGGPLMLEAENKIWKQIGIVSWGDGCGDETPGMYFRTTEIVQWINYVVNSNRKFEKKEKDAATWCLGPEK